MFHSLLVGVAVQLAEKVDTSNLFLCQFQIFTSIFTSIKSTAFEIIKYPVSLILFIYPRPTNGILLAITVMKSTFASKGSPAI